jgi:hypothetical protein
VQFAAQPTARPLACENGPQERYPLVCLDLIWNYRFPSATAIPRLVVVPLPYNLAVPYLTPVAEPSVMLPRFIAASTSPIGHSGMTTFQHVFTSTRPVRLSLFAQACIA